jgi:predicted dehydrogenase
MERREFLRRAGRGVVGTGLGLLVLPRWARGAAPSDTVVMGHIGVRGIGGQHLRWFLPRPDCRVEALCDVDAKVLEGKLKQVHSRYGNTQAKGYRDYRELLDRKDIDAISYGTPDHWHALMAVHAFQAGKDVYGEKPMSWCQAEARAMLDACNRYRRVFQLGCQRHAFENMHRCAELVRSGALGTIHTVRCWKGCRAPNFPCVPDEPAPPHLDYDLWLGPAPQRPYNKYRCHYNFRFFWDYSAGDYVNWWCHVHDLVYFALEHGAPTTVASRGDVIAEGQADAMKWIDIDIAFPRFKYFWTTRAPDHPAVVNRGLGMIFEGTQGTLGADFGKRKILLGGQTLTDLPSVPKTLPRSPGHQRDFLNCVRSRREPTTGIRYAYAMTVPMCLGRVSFHLRRPIRWDPEREQVVGDEPANRLLRRVYREPWVLPA